MTEQINNKGTPPEEYIRGEALFMGLKLFCTPDTLIPRKETELLVEVGLDFLEHLEKRGQAPDVIDVGTGSANIPIYLALHTNRARFIAVDVSHGAIAVARRNVSRYTLEKRIRVVLGDFLDPVRDADPGRKFDMIISNPPYIPTASLANLDSKIVEHEPLLALDAGAYGIDFFRRLIKEAGAMLNSGGRLVFEIGERQERLVARLFRGFPSYRNIQMHTDGNSIRVISAEKSDSKMGEQSA